MSAFEKYFRQLLEKSELTKAELARNIGLKRQNYIGNILSGMHIPTLERIDQIAKALKCSEDEKNRLTKLAVEGRSPKDAKKYLTNYSRYQPARRLEELFFSQKPEGKETDSVYLNELLDSFLAEVNGNFLEPIAAKGQKIIYSNFNDPENIFEDYKKNDLLILGFRLNEKNLRSLETYPYEKARISKTAYVIGALIQKNSDSIKLQHPKNKKIISLRLEDVFIKSKIFGVLFLDGPR